MDYDDFFRSKKGSSSKSRGKKTFDLEIIQHPLRARMCGFGGKDRRPIDPPPAVKLLVYDENSEPIEQVNQLLDETASSKMIVSVSLFSEDGAKQCDVVINPSSVPTPQNSNYNNLTAVMSLNEPQKMKNLIGTTVSPGYCLQDEKKKFGTFFIFNDLSVRTEGRFCLKFSFMNLEDQLEHESYKILAQKTSKPFDVYSAKNFPGMTGSTELSKSFFNQGVRLTIRKHPRTKLSNLQSEEMENEEDQPDT
ncbi:hypothetical protein AYI68_g1015 [Smittium mucronatum]|uniref:Velvet domain-containing protein n=1 Tax=Smittium mucronatum TaxID=133383 RepID=A0A1R0H6U8_9FUNG|nr:hypothetical protein AYI68_g1015 [Smittium mucronatum]